MVVRKAEGASEEDKPAHKDWTEQEVGLIVLGGSRDLSESVRRLGGGRCEFIRVTTRLVAGLVSESSRASAKARVGPMRWSNWRTGSNPASLVSWPGDGSRMSELPKKSRICRPAAGILIGCLPGCSNDGIRLRPTTSTNAPNHGVKVAVLG